MSIKIKCACGKTFELPDENAGKTGKCAGCGATIDVPAGLHLVHETSSRPLPEGSPPPAAGAWAPPPASPARSLSPQAQLYLALGVGGGLVALFAVALFVFGAPPPPAENPPRPGAPAGPPLVEEPAPPHDGSPLRIEAAEPAAFSKAIAGPGDVTLRARVARGRSVDRDGRATRPIDVFLEIAGGEPGQILGAGTSEVESCADDAGRPLELLAAEGATLSFVPGDGEPSRAIRSLSGSIEIRVSSGSREVSISNLGGADGQPLAHPALEEAGIALKVHPLSTANEIRLRVRRISGDLRTALARAELAVGNDSPASSGSWSDVEGTVELDFGERGVPAGVVARLLVVEDGRPVEVVLSDLETRIGTRIQDPALEAAGIEVVVAQPRSRVRLEVGEDVALLAAAELETAAAREAPLARAPHLEWRVEAKDLTAAKLRLRIASGVSAIRIPIALENLEIPGD